MRARAMRRRLSVLTILFLFLSFTMALPLVWAGSGGKLGAKLTDRELNQIRGGYSGFYFGVYFSGYWDTLGNMQGSLVYDGNVTNTSNSLPTLGGSDVQASNGATIQAYVGDFGGASGIFQISQSPGSYNLIQNTMVVEITIINVANESALAALQAYLPWN